MIKTHPFRMDFSDDLRPRNTMAEWVCETPTDEQIKEAVREFNEALLGLIFAKNLDA